VRSSKLAFVRSELYVRKWVCTDLRELGGGDAAWLFDAAKVTHKN